jgi:hypothetical protein
VADNLKATSLGIFITVVKQFTLGLFLIFASLAVRASSDCYPIESADIFEKNAPKFEQYLVKEIYQGKIAELDTISHNYARRFKTVLTSVR